MPGIDKVSSVVDKEEGLTHRSMVKLLAPGWTAALSGMVTVLPAVPSSSKTLPLQPAA